MSSPYPRPLAEVDLAREIESLRRILDYLPTHVSGHESCWESEKLRSCVSSARQTLGRIEAAFQDEHLSCCMIPNGPNDLTRGLSRLRDRRLGAIIACEHQQDLADYAARGIPFGVPLSVRALEAIFGSGSRLRQGATIVRGTRLVAAGVPLALAAEKVDSTGRVLTEPQRSALALSRLTDALVFVVADGTGELSVALDGHLRPVQRL